MPTWLISFAALYWFGQGFVAFLLYTFMHDGILHRYYVDVVLFSYNQMYAMKHCVELVLLITRSRKDQVHHEATRLMTINSTTASQLNIMRPLSAWHGMTIVQVFTRLFKPLRPRLPRVDVVVRLLLVPIPRLVNLLPPHNPRCYFWRPANFYLIWLSYLILKQFLKRLETII